MNTLLWVLQALTALVFGASGVMKAFLFDKVSSDVPSFGALPKPAWLALGALELVCAMSIVVPAALNWHPGLTTLAAALLACETVLFVWVHIKYREVAPIVFSVALGCLTAFIAYGRGVLAPIG